MSSSASRHLKDETSIEHTLYRSRARAVITGALGIGRSIALYYARSGGHRGGRARRHELEALEVALGGRCLPRVCDVTDAGQVSDGGALDEFGGVDIRQQRRMSEQRSPIIRQLWHQIPATNLTSVYYVTKAFTPTMIEQGGGRIIMIASVAAKAGGRYIAAYTASKHGVLGLTRALASELVGSNITVNAICPGYVDTPMTQASIENITRGCHRDQQLGQAVHQGGCRPHGLGQPAGGITRRSLQGQQDRWPNPLGNEFGQGGKDARAQNP